MTDVFKERLVEMLVDARAQLQQRLSSENTKTCEICGIAHFRTDSIEYESGIEVYVSECRNCKSLVSFHHLYIVIPELSIEEHEYPGNSCMGEGCQPTEFMMKAIVDDEEPMEKTVHTLPVKGTLQTMVHDHHLSYDPEETIPVCSKCHSKIHHDDDFRPDLVPEMTREEWVAKT